jgi:hypothetical protein
MKRMIQLKLRILYIWKKIINIKKKSDEMNLYIVMKPSLIWLVNPRLARLKCKEKSFQSWSG